MSDFDLLTCPLPGCSHDLHLVWSNDRALYASDLDKTPPLDDVHTTSWQVQCEDGHVVLVPAASRCAVCDDEGCPDDGCDIDGSDDYRTFRTSDGRRLADLLAAMNGEPR